MSSIQTAIELSDRMSAPLYNICTAVNMVISNFEALEYASSTAIDTSSMEEARQLLADSMVGLQDITSCYGERTPETGGIQPEDTGWITAYGCSRE